MIEEFRTRYFDFTAKHFQALPAKHFHEAIHGRPMADGTSFVRGYTWTKSVLQGRGLTTKAPKRSAHRKKRAAPAPAGHAGVPGRLAARLAAAGTPARSRGDPGRRHKRDPLGCPGRGGRHGFELCGAAGGPRT